MAKEQRLIDANALRNQVMNEIRHYWNCGEGGYYLAEDVIPDIDNAPTVDAVEVVHGYWEYGKWEQGHWVKGNERCRCSVCHRDFAVDNSNIWHGCPQCLAKMDGDGNG